MSSAVDLIVIGTGVAGLSAATTARQANVATTMVESLMFGGLITNINELDGPVHGNGSEYAANLMARACDLGAENVSATVEAIERDGDAWCVVTDSQRLRARALIVASGARVRPLGVPGESELEGSGVSRCADCDGPMFGGQDVVVIGGGDSAIQEAAALAGYARRVHVVHRGSAFRARPHLVERLIALPNVEVHWHSAVQAILGDGVVTGVSLVGANGAVAELACAGVFPYIGLEPMTGFVPALVARDLEGRLTTDEMRQTSVPGIFAAGAVRAGCGGLVSDAEADGVAAARAAAKYLGR